MSVLTEFQNLRHGLQQGIVGQHVLIDRLLIALLCDGHLLVEGAPGLAKTRAVRLLGEAVEGSFHRLQFTPDLLPADLTGTDVFRPQDGSFRFQEGPLFHNLILADEINRAPAKVQSALLEAMAERQITVGPTTHRLPRMFLVMATQNPIEQEGTYALPEAQLDRFLMHVRVDYPDADEERLILDLNRREALEAVDGGASVSHIVTQDDVFAARREVLGVYLSEHLEAYLIELVLATREPGRLSTELAAAIQYGASPRASIALDRCARASAWMSGRDYVSPDDIQAVAADILRHRLILTYEAEAEGMTPDNLIGEILGRVPVP
jgi:MoxR-like ATPase